MVKPGIGTIQHWLEGQGGATTLDHIDELVFRRFIIHLQEKPGTKARTLYAHIIYNRVNAIRSFFGWLALRS